MAEYETSGDKLGREDCWELIQRMLKRFQGGEKLHDVVKVRQQHFYNEPAVNPQALDGFEGHARQVTILRDTAVKLRARLTENEWRPQVKAQRVGARWERKAKEAEEALVSMFADLRSNTGIDIQGGLADGLIRDCYGVLHWYLCDEDVNRASAKIDYEERDELPEDEDEQRRYTEDEYAEAAGKTKKQRYRETDESVMDRRARARASAKPAWMVEIVPATHFAYVRDRSSVTGEYLYGLRVEEIDLIDWFEGRKWADSMLKQAPAPTDVMVGGGTSDTWRPSATDWTTRVTLYQLWSRDYIYEYVEGLPPEALRDDPKQDGLRYRCIPNRQRCVPFAVAPGAVTASDDPVHMYEPALTSLYRLKPMFDRYVTHLGILAEAGAVPRYVLQPLDNSMPPLTDDDGHIKVFTDKALEGMRIPEGYKVERFGGDGISGDYWRLFEVLKAELDDARPSTGKAEFGASTQPWTARIIQQEENIEPRMYLDNIANALMPMVRNIIEVNASAEGPGDFAYYPRDAKGKRDTSAVRVLKPEDWEGLQVEIDINPVSQSEQISRMEHLRMLLNDPLTGYTPIEFIEEGEGKPNGQEVWAERVVFKFWLDTMMPGELRAAAAEWAGLKFALTPDGTVDAMGRAVKPAEVLQANGQPFVQVPQMMPHGGGPGPMSGAAPMGQVMPSLGQPAGGPQGMMMPDGLVG